MIKEQDIGIWPKQETAEVLVPEQTAEPDWATVAEIARCAAEATMLGKMQEANDLYQNLAIEAMHTLYGPNAVVRFINYAMEQEAKKIVIARPDEYRFKV